MTTLTRRALPLVLAVCLVAAACSGDGDDGGRDGATGGSTTTAPAAADSPCAGPTGVGGAVPAGLGPGDVVKATDLSGASASSKGFPAGTRVWRVLYVSTGVDEHDLQLVCGMVAVRGQGPGADAAGRGRLLAWSHGTIGVQQRCLPSADPATHLWGPMDSGIGAVSWGALLSKHQGPSAGGAFQHAMAQGWVVAAADYQPETYIVGRIAAANVLDVSRAATQLMATTFPRVHPDAYDMVTWGHSQGGHAAMWAGQLAQPYLEGTKSSRPTASIRLAGVALEAPASNFVAQPARQPGVAFGDGLADWEMHQSVEIVGLPISFLEVQIGPALFSYIFGSWSHLSAGRAPAAGAAFPAFPAGASHLDLTKVATPEGAATISRVMALCLSGKDGLKVKSAVAPYRDAAKHRMLVPPVWNLPTSGYQAGDYFKGGLDRTCATTKDAGLTAWCDWVRYNLPGPMGTNPFPKVPAWDGVPVPLFVAQGDGDNIIHCLPPEGTPSTATLAPADCMSRALFDSLSSAAYCPAGRPKSSLRLVVVASKGSLSPATHLAIPGEIGAREISSKKADLVFDGSPVERFVTSAFDRAATPGCTAEVRTPA